MILFLLTSALVKAQTEINVQDSISLEQLIYDKIGESIKLNKEYEYKKALTIIKQCIRQADSIKNDSLLGEAYGISGIIYSYLGKETEAIINHRKSEGIYTEMKDYGMVGQAYNNIAFAYSNNSKNQDSTIQYLKKAYNTYKYNGNTKELTLIAANLGESYKENNELEKSIKYLDKAIHLAEIYNKKEELSYAHLTYAKVYLKKKNLQKSLTHLNLSQEIAEKEDYEQDLVLIYKLIELVS